MNKQKLLTTAATLATTVGMVMPANAAMQHKPSLDSSDPSHSTYFKNASVPRGLPTDTIAQEYKLQHLSDSHSFNGANAEPVEDAVGKLGAGSRPNNPHLTDSHIDTGVQVGGRVQRAIEETRGGCARFVRNDGLPECEGRDVYGDVNTSVNGVDISSISLNPNDIVGAEFRGKDMVVIINGVEIPANLSKKYGHKVGIDGGVGDMRASFMLNGKPYSIKKLQGQKHAVVLERA